MTDEDESTCLKSSMLNSRLALKETAKHSWHREDRDLITHLLQTKAKKLKRIIIYLDYLD